MLAMGMNLDPKELQHFEAALQKGRRGRKEVLHLGLLMNEKLAHFDLLQTDDAERARWGFIVFDEVDRLPANCWRVAAQLEAARVIGLTATAIREDGRITDEDAGAARGELFNLVGPVAHELSYPEARKGGWIAEARCSRVEVPLTGKERSGYDNADVLKRRDIAWHNSGKIAVVQAIIRRHRGKPTIVIGHFLRSLHVLSRALGRNVPYLNGNTTHEERERVYDDFRVGRHSVIVVSSIADRAIDFPDAEVLVQMNGLFGSRAQEGQRLGRVLRPKDRPAYYYNLVTPETPEEDDADKRQGYLAAHGFGFRVIRASELLRSY